VARSHCLVVASTRARGGPKEITTLARGNFLRASCITATWARGVLKRISVSVLPTTETAALARAPPYPCFQSLSSTSSTSTSSDPHLDWRLNKVHTVLQTFVLLHMRGPFSHRVATFAIYGPIEAII
jgi:hypothetical protein